MKRILIIMALLSVVSVCGSTSYLFGYYRGLNFAEQVHRESMDRMFSKIKEYREESEYYKFWLDKMTCENEQAKADIEALTEACTRLEDERDVYYKALHECLNMP